MNPDLPRDVCFIRGQIDFWWDPEQFPSFDPSDLEFFNGIANEVSVRPIRQQAQMRDPNDRREHLGLQVSGLFKSYNDYTDFPFDRHEVGIIAFDAQSLVDQIQFRGDAPDFRDRLRFRAATNGWTIESISFFKNANGFLHSVPVDDHDREYSFFAVTIGVSRNLSGHLVRIFFPMLLIWSLSYMSHFWNDSSPASRFGGSALIAAVAFSLGVRPMVPDTGYLMAINTAFLGLYAVIAFDTIITAITFSYRGAKNEVAAKRWRLLGRIVSPVLAVLVGIVFIGVARSSSSDALFSTPPTIKVQLNSQ